MARREGRLRWQAGGRPGVIGGAGRTAAGVATPRRERRLARRFVWPRCPGAVWGALRRARLVSRAAVEAERSAAGVPFSGGGLGAPGANAAPRLASLWVGLRGLGCLAGGAAAESVGAGRVAERCRGAEGVVRVSCLRGSWSWEETAGRRRRGDLFAHRRWGRLCPAAGAVTVRLWLAACPAARSPACLTV